VKWQTVPVCCIFSFLNESSIQDYSMYGVIAAYSDTIASSFEAKRILSMIAS